MGEGGTKGDGVTLAVTVEVAVEVAEANGAGVVAFGGVVGDDVGVGVAPSGARCRATQPMQ